MEAERLLAVEEMGIVPSWGTGRQGLEKETVMAATMRLEMVTGIELREGSELRQSLLKTCEWRERNDYRGMIKSTKQCNQKKNGKLYKIFL